MKFDFSKYKGKYAMHCKTEEEAKDFCRAMHEDGRKWWWGYSYISETHFDTAKGDIYYHFNDGTWDKLEYFKSNNFEILQWEDFMEKQFTKADLKDGMVGVDRVGRKYIILNEYFMGENGVTCLCEPPSAMNDDLSFSDESYCDIMRICTSNGTTLAEYFNSANLTTIWQRPEEVTEMTVTEIKEALGIDGTLKIKEG